MKKQLLILIVMATAICQAKASERTIVKPESIYQNMLALSRTDSVIMNDTATVFYLHIARRDEKVIYFSHETCLKDMKGRTYPLRQLISDFTLQPDEPRTFDDIGKNVLDVQLVFPPLPADVTEVDMIDPQFYNHGIFSIRLDGSPLPPFQLPKDVEVRLKEIMAVQDTLPKVDYRFGWATIKGHLMDYRPGMCSQMTLVLRHLHSSQHQIGDTLCAQVSPTGDFSFRLPVAHITPVSLTFEPQHLGFGIAYVEPDTETEVYFNMREINVRHMYSKNNNTIFYVTKGPLAQLANELNEHFFFDRIDFIEKHFKHFFTDGEEWERHKEIQAMLPTKQLELRMAELDTMKVEEQWSPAMKELVRQYWQMQTVMRVSTTPPRELENEANVTGLPLATEGTLESSIAKEKLIAWQRDAVVAELEAFEQLIKDPKMVYCPDLSDLIDFSIRINTVLPSFIDCENTIWKLQDQMSKEFRLLDSDEIAETLANLPPAYQQLLLAWQDIFREEYNRLDEKVIVGDTLQGIPDSLVFQTLCERYRGQTIFVSFWLFYNPVFANNVILPLQQELANHEIVWVNIYNSNRRENGAGWENADRLRYFTKLQGEQYYYHMSSRMDWLKDLYKTMGITNPLANVYCIVSPDSRIVRNSDSKPIPISLMANQDYLGIRHCLLQTAMPRTIQNN